jgi:competence protein ComEA
MKNQIACLLIVLLLTTGIVSAAQPSASGVVNINTADTAELELLPRVGPSLAGRIVAFREANGPFERPEDLLAVKGIGEKSFDHLKPYVAISGETTLNEKVRLPKTKKGDATKAVGSSG